MKRWVAAGLVAMLAVPALAQDSAEPIHPPPHTSPWPVLGTGPTEGMRTASLALGPEMERGRSPKEMLADRRKLDAALHLGPERQAGRAHALGRPGAEHRPGRSMRGRMDGFGRILRERGPRQHHRQNCRPEAFHHPALSSARLARATGSVKRTDAAL